MADSQRMNKKYYEGQTSRLPSQDALESNKKRQDKEMKSAVKDYMKSLTPGGAAGVAMDKIQEAKNRKDEYKAAKNRSDSIKRMTEAEGLPKMQRGINEEYKSGGSVKSSASKRADGCATKGKTRGKMV